MTDELKRIWKEAIIAQSTYYLGNCMDGLRNTTKYLSAMGAGWDYVGLFDNFIFESVQNIMTEGYCLLTCDAMYSRKGLRTFRGYVLSRFSKCKDLKSSVFFGITTL
jgi:hypothetical protein